MSSLRNPVGPQPASVYWRRRLLVLLGILAVVVVVVLIVVRPPADGGGTATPAPPAATPSASAVADGECRPGVVQIEPVTDSNSYAAGVQPQISMTITNVGAAPCTFDVGPAAQEYIIMSGSDLIWNSRDCLSGESLVQTLEPNVALSTTPFPWDRARSSPDTCTTSRPEVIAGGATYRLSVKLGDEVESPSDVPFILN